MVSKVPKSRVDQSGRLAETARRFGVDEDEAAFKEKLAVIARHREAHHAVAIAPLDNGSNPHFLISVPFALSGDLSGIGQARLIGLEHKPCDVRNVLAGEQGNLRGGAAVPILPNDCEPPRILQRRDVDRERHQHAFSGCAQPGEG